MSDWTSKYEVLEESEDGERRLRFLHGECDLFAYAMHQITGLPIKAMYDTWTTDEGDELTVLVHAYLDYNGQVLDALGVTDVMDLEERYEEQNGLFNADFDLEDVFERWKDTDRLSEENLKNITQDCNRVLEEIGYEGPTSSMRGA